jgi:hypothetical protein
MSASKDSDRALRATGCLGPSTARHSHIACPGHQHACHPTGGGAATLDLEADEPSECEVALAQGFVTDSAAGFTEGFLRGWQAHWEAIPAATIGVGQVSRHRLEPTSTAPT